MGDHPAALRLELPRIAHHCGDGQLMVLADELQRRRRFKPDML